MKIPALISFRPPSAVLRKSLCLNAFVLLTTYCFLFTAYGQDEMPVNSAPPPLKLLSKDEKSALEAEKDIRRRNKLAIDLMEARLKKAEQRATEESFRAVFEELGGFHALMNNALGYLRQNNTGRGKFLDNFKRLELALRGFLPRIELIRRELPGDYDFYISKLLKEVRDARAQAVEPMFSDAVVPNADNDN